MEYGNTEGCYAPGYCRNDNNASYHWYTSVRGNCGENLSSHYTVDQGVTEKDDDVEEDDELAWPPSHSVAAEDLHYIRQYGCLSQLP